MPVLDKLFVALGYDYDEKKLKKFNSIVISTGKLLKRLAVSAIGAATAFGLLAISMTRSILNSFRMAKGFGVLRRELVSIQRLSEKLTGSETPGENLFAKLSQARRRALIGDPDAGMLEGLSALGLEPMRILLGDVKESALEIANAFRNANEFERSLFRVRFGLEDADALLLEGLTRATLKANEPTRANEAVMEQFNSALFDFKNSLTDKLVPLLNAALPQFRATIERLIDWVSLLKDEDIIKFYKKIEDAVIDMAVAARDLSTIIKPIADFINRHSINDPTITGNTASPNFIGPPHPTPEQMIDRSKQRGIIERDRIGDLSFNIEMNVNTNASDPVAVGNSIANALSIEINRLASGLKSVPVA